MKNQADENMLAQKVKNKSFSFEVEKDFGEVLCLLTSMTTANNLAWVAATETNSKEAWEKKLSAGEVIKTFAEGDLCSFETYGTIADTVKFLEALMSEGYDFEGSNHQGLSILEVITHPEYSEYFILHNDDDSEMECAPNDPDYINEDEDDELKPDDENGRSAYNYRHNDRRAEED